MNLISAYINNNVALLLALAVILMLNSKYSDLSSSLFNFAHSYNSLFYTFNVEYLFSIQIYILLFNFIIFTCLTGAHKHVKLTKFIRYAGIYFLYIVLCTYTGEHINNFLYTRLNQLNFFFNVQEIYSFSHTIIILLIYVYGVVFAILYFLELNNIEFYYTSIKKFGLIIVASLLSVFFGGLWSFFNDFDLQFWNWDLIEIFFLECIIFLSLGFHLTFFGTQGVRRHYIFYNISNILFLRFFRLSLLESKHHLSIGELFYNYDCGPDIELGVQIHDSAYVYFLPLLCILPTLSAVTLKENWKLSSANSNIEVYVYYHVFYYLSFLFLGRLLSSNFYQINQQYIVLIYIYFIISTALSLKGLKKINIYVFFFSIINARAGFSYLIFKLLGSKAKKKNRINLFVIHTLFYVYILVLLSNTPVVYYWTNLAAAPLCNAPLTTNAELIQTRYIFDRVSYWFSIDSKYTKCVMIAVISVLYKYAFNYSYKYIYKRQHYPSHYGPLMIISKNVIQVKFISK